MEKNVINATTFIKREGRKEDYINLPITNGDKIIGVIMDCHEAKGDRYMLTIALWQELNIEKIYHKPIAFSIK